MSTRISDSIPGVPAALLLLGACHQGAPTAGAVVGAGGDIECALPGADGFARVCAVERTATRDGLQLTIRQPDGGFQRLLVTQDGRGVIAADGAEPAVVTPIADNRIEVALAGARYRLPATVRGKPQ